MDIFSVTRGLIGLIIVTALAFLFSRSRHSISWRLVLVGLGLQFIFAFVVLKTDVGREVMSVISTWFVQLFSFALEGAQFVFGSLAKPPDQPGSLGFFFAFQVLPTIIFFASLMGTLYYLGVMQRVVQRMA